jgi:hypothetical protein
MLSITSMDAVPAAVAVKTDEPPKSAPPGVPVYVGELKLVPDKALRKVKDDAPGAETVTVLAPPTPVNMVELLAGDVIDRDPIEPVTLNGMLTELPKAVTRIDALPLSKPETFMVARPKPVSVLTKPELRLKVVESEAVNVTGTTKGNTFPLLSLTTALNVTAFPPTVNAVSPALFTVPEVVAVSVAPLIAI